MGMAEKKNNVTCSGVEVKTKTKGDELEIVSVVVNTKQGQLLPIQIQVREVSVLNKNEKET